MPAVAAAVQNNAVWCDTVCRARGARTEWVDGLWVNIDASPPYYPNAATTSPHETSAQRRRLQRLLGSLPRPWSVKDGFHVLDLDSLGFHLLFEAQWIRLPVSGRADDHLLDPIRDADDAEWSAAASAAELEEWEASWRGDDPGAAVADPPATFAPALVDDPDLRFLAGRRGGRIVAVAAANRSDDGTGPVVGISNLVLCRDGQPHDRAGAVHAVRAAFPGLPLVGYERGDDLSAMVALGAQATAPLRIWITDA
jgi:hypothetical protein